MTDVTESSASELEERVRQLETALETRIVIEQAKGVLVGRHGIDVAAAFKALRNSARASQQRLRDLARRIVEEPNTPDEVRRSLDEASLDD